MALVVGLVSPIAHQNAFAYTVRGAIFIDGDAAFTAVNGVTGGSGTALDPYLIEGWEISGAGGWAIEIRNTNAPFVIRGVYVHGGGAVFFNSANNGRIENSEIRDDSVRFDGVANLVVAGNTLSGGDLSVNDGTNVNLTGNVFTGSLYLLPIDGFVLDGNTASGITAGGRNGRISSNTLGPSGLVVGVANIDEVATVDIAPDNTAAGAPIVAHRNCDGLVSDGETLGQLIVLACSRVTVSGLQANPLVTYPLQLLFVDNATVLSNELAATILASRIDNVTFLRNVLDGLWVAVGKNVIVVENSIGGLSLGGAPFGGVPTSALVEGNEVGGIALEGFHDATVVGNRVVNGSIYSRGAAFLTVIDNTIQDVPTGGFAIYLWDCFSCQVRHNNVINASSRAFDNWPSGNPWDDFYPSGGNYWSDYSGADDCSGPNQNVCPDPDGTGDAAVPIFGGFSVDRYPLMSPRNAPPKVYLTVTPLVGSTDTTFLTDSSQSWDVLSGRTGLETRWDWEDDGAWDTVWSSSTTGSHRYPSPGTYTIRSGVRDPAGLTNTTLQQVVVQNRAPVASFVVQPTSGTAATSFAVDASGAFDPEDSAAVEIRWDWESDGSWDTAWTTQRTTTRSYSEPGNYTISLEVRDSVGLVSNYALVVRVLNTAPVASFTSTPVRGSVETVFRVDASASTDLESDPPQLEVRWDWEDDGTWDTAWTAAKTAEHRYASPGPRVIRLEMRDPHGATATSTVSIEVTAPGGISPTGSDLVPWILMVVVGTLGVSGVVVALRSRRRHKLGGHRPDEKE